MLSGSDLDFCSIPITLLFFELFMCEEKECVLFNMIPKYLTLALFCSTKISQWFAICALYCNKP